MLYKKYILQLLLYLSIIATTVTFAENANSFIASCYLSSNNSTYYLQQSNDSNAVSLLRSFNVAQGDVASELLWSIGILENSFPSMHCLHENMLLLVKDNYFDILFLDIAQKEIFTIENFHFPNITYQYNFSEDIYLLEVKNIMGERGAIVLDIRERTILFKNVTRLIYHSFILKAKENRFLLVQEKNFAEDGYEDTFFQVYSLQDNKKIVLSHTCALDSRIVLRDGWVDMLRQFPVGEFAELASIYQAEQATQPCKDILLEFYHAPL